MRRIFFMHIAKTNGVSLEENLLHATALGACPAYSWADLLKIENPQKYVLFIGHLSYFCNGIIGEAFRCTVLRDPVK